MLNRSNNNSLNALLLVQETLRPLVAGTTSLAGVLPDVLVSLLDAVDSQDGRLVVVNLEPDNNTVVSVINGRVEIETAGAVLETAEEENESFANQHGRQLYITDTQNEDGWFVVSHPETTTSSWSAISVPIRTEESIVGLLTLLKQGRDCFVQEDIVLSSLFAGQIGAALTALRLKEEMQSAEDRSQELLRDSQDLAAILVHDLQGPLGNVLTSLETAQEGLDHQGESSVSLMMDIAVRSSRHLQVLVNSLLDISRLEAGQEITDLQPISVSDIIDYAAEAQGPMLEQRQVTLAREPSPNLPLINANADILQRVLLNLIDNALKVSKHNQIITIQATVESDDDVVAICVVDQGPGIPEAYRERVFEKYQRVNDMSSSKGLGLGLAFCKLAVEAHGGRIWVQDTPDNGACFCFTVPLADNPDPASFS